MNREVREMATPQEYVDFVLDQIDDRWEKRSRKMFGEYMVYVDERPLLLVCDSTVYVRERTCVESLLRDHDKGIPYPGAKEHYVLDVQDRELLDAVLEELVRAVPAPVRRPKRGGR
jgi:TfoX/Sxy family transcriptional regulator of competence genes